MNHSHVDLQETYKELRSKAYTRAIDALLAYQQMCYHICHDDEIIDIEVQGLQIIVKNIELE